jgi:hypothetical protein
MADMTWGSRELVIALTAWEKVAALRGDVRVPLSAVRSVEVVDKPMPTVRGLRAPGLSWPGRTKLGTWRRRDGRTFAAVRAGRAAVRIRLDGQPYDELVVSVDDPARVARELVRADAPT